MKVKKELLATKIRVEWNDGSVSESANTEDAASIMKHWNSGEVMAYVHGARYNGPMLKQVRPPMTIKEGMRLEIHLDSFTCGHSTILAVIELLRTLGYQVAPQPEVPNAD